MLRFLEGKKQRKKSCYPAESEIYRYLQISAAKQAHKHILLFHPQHRKCIVYFLSCPYNDNVDGVAYIGNDDGC